MALVGTSTDFGMAVALQKLKEKYADSRGVSYFESGAGPAGRNLSRESPRLGSRRRDGDLDDAGDPPGPGQSRQATALGLPAI